MSYTEELSTRYSSLTLTRSLFSLRRIMAHKIYKELMKFMSILFIFSKAVMTAITVKPTDVETLVGEVAYFNCSTSKKPAKPDDILWYHTPVHSNQREDVYDEGRIRYRYEGRFHVEADLSVGAFNLIVSTATLEDAGRYECQDRKGHGEKVSAQLIIIDIVDVDSTIKKTKNENVTCTANTSFPCNNHTWYDSQQNLIGSGRYLKPMNPGLYRCEAQCHIRNESCNIIAMKIEVVEDVAEPVANLHLLWILLLSLPPVVIGLCVWRRKRVKSKKLRLMIEEIELSCRPIKDDLLKTIRTKSAEEDKSIEGLTILDEELFIVSRESSVVEVYDSIEFSFSRRFELKELKYPVDIGSCNRNKCLYIMDRKAKNQSKEILRVDPSEKLINPWLTGDDWGQLSITDEANVILTVFNTNKLIEYSPVGQLLREINLSSDRGLVHLQHAIRLIDDYFVVCHGDGGDRLHRVCLVDVDGKVINLFGGKRGSTDRQLNLPVYLTEDGNGSILVADRENSRVLLLNSNLEFKREIVFERKHNLRDPSKICLDEWNGRLFVADNKWDEEKKIFTDGKVLVFDVKNKISSI